MSVEITRWVNNSGQVESQEWSLIDGDNTTVTENAGAKTIQIDATGGGGGSGTVTSVAVTVPAGFTASGSPVTSSGTIAIAFDAGYSLPTDAKQTNWDTAFGWGDHSTQGYLTSQTSHADVVVDGDFGSDGILVRSGGAGVYTTITDSSANWDTAYTHSQTTSGNPHSVSMQEAYAAGSSITTGFTGLTVTAPTGAVPAAVVMLGTYEAADKGGALIFGATIDGDFVSGVLTADRAMVTGSLYGDGVRIQSSAVTATELGYVSGVTSAIQTQIDGKAASSHTHAASEITSGTLTHERGGLEADVSVYSGLVKISGGATSQVTDNSANWDAAYAHSQVATGNPHSVTKSDIGLGVVENTALSTWSGSSNLTTLGTITSGVWNGTAIEGAAIASTGEAGGNKFLREDGDGTCSWQSIAGGGDLLAANNLSELTATASTARANLGLTIGTHVQAYDADLTTWAGLTPSANAQSLVTAADYAAMRALLDLEAGTDFYTIAATDSAIDTDIATHAAVTSSVHGITAAAATVLDDATVAAMVNTLGGATSTGSGGLVRATSPTLVTPALGTPSSGNASNLTALNATQLTTGTIPAARVGTDHIDALTEIASALKAGTGSKLVTNGNDASIPIYTEKHSASHTISAAECYGGVHYVTSAATITLPAAAAGMSVTIITVGAIAVSVDPNASDLIMLDGVALDDGDKITNLSTTGDIAVLTYYDATGWYAATNGWTDGGV